jgi:signal transduction histidine kinase
MVAGWLLSPRTVVLIGGLNLSAIAAAVVLQPRIPVEAVAAAMAFNTLTPALVLAGVRHRDRVERDRRRVVAAAEAHARDQERLAELGTLAAAIAHELANPLAAASVTVAGLRRAPVAEIEAGEAELRLDEVADCLARMSALLASLRSMSRDDGDERARTDVGEALRSSMALAGTELRHRGRMELHLESLPEVRANHVRLGQVFLNLLINATHALPSNRAGNFIRVEARKRDDGFVEVEISDNGTGIPPEVLPYIFDAFRTSKPPGQGTGLGLWLCRRIIDQLGGRLEVESRPGEGSTFTVVLPIAEDRR